MAQPPNDRVLLRLAPIYTSIISPARAARLACKGSLAAVQNARKNFNDPFALRRNPDLSEMIKLALTATEYHVNFLWFSLSRSTCPRSLSIDSIKLAQIRTRQLETELSSIEPPSEEGEARMRRIEKCFRDIISTVEEWNYPRNSRTGMVSIE